MKEHIHEWEQTDSYETGVEHNGPSLNVTKAPRTRTTEFVCECGASKVTKVKINQEDTK